MHLLCLAANACIDKLGEVDSIEHGQIHRLPPLTVVPGGKGLNVARAAAALGAEVKAIGFLAGHAGRWIADTLPSFGVEGGFVWTDGETRHCLSIYERAQGALTEFYESPSPIRPADWSELVGQWRLELGKEVGLVTISGGLPQGAPIDGYAHLCRIAGKTGTRVLLDSHGPALREALAARPWLVKVNAEEASEVSQSGEEPLALAHTLRQLGAEHALVTRGPAGAVISSAAGDWLIGPPSTVGQYPVGSGDAFLAGLAVRTLAGDPLTDAARYGTAAAIANALRPGAGVLDRDDVGGLLQAVSLQRLS